MVSPSLTGIGKKRDQIQLQSHWKINLIWTYIEFSTLETKSLQENALVAEAMRKFS